MHYYTVLSALSLVLPVAEAPPPPAPLTATSIEPTIQERGKTVTVTFADGADLKGDLWLRLAPAEAVIAARQHPTADGPAVPIRAVALSGKPSDHSYSAVLPPDLPLGDWLVGVSRTKDSPLDALTFPLHVTRGDAAPKLSAIDPLTGYPTDKGFDFILLGDGFSEVPEDNVLVIDGRDEIRADWNDGADYDKADNGAAVVRGVFYSTHKLEFRGLPLHFVGKGKVRLRVGDRRTEAVAMTLAQVNRWVPLVIAFFLTMLLALAILWAATRGLKGVKIDGTTIGPLGVLLLERQTNSYSLSKFQLYAWTAAAVFGYVYLTCVRSLIQGTLEFATVPENLPALLLVSATTTAVSAGITATRGPKGAGEVLPSVSDLVTSGGLVSAERFQFFVWTVLGVAAFVFLIVAADPATFSELPKIPEPFLYLMGVSSVGYLGGKLAHKRGPVVNSVAAKVENASLTLEMSGSGLSRDAGFELDDEEVTWAVFDPQTRLSPPADKDATLEMVRDDGAGPTSEFAAALRLRMTDRKDWLRRQGKPDDALDAPPRAPAPAPPAAPARPATHRLTVINRDGQRATATFTILPL